VSVNPEYPKDSQKKKGFPQVFNWFLGRQLRFRIPVSASYVLWQCRLGFHLNPRTA
jgi:hypothetical protein